MAITWKEFYVGLVILGEPYEQIIDNILGSSAAQVYLPNLHYVDDQGTIYYPEVGLVELRMDIISISRADDVTNPGVDITCTFTLNDYQEHPPGVLNSLFGPKFTVRFNRDFECLEEAFWSIFGEYFSSDPVPENLLVDEYSPLHTD